MGDPYRTSAEHDLEDRLIFIKPRAQSSSDLPTFKLALECKKCGSKRMKRVLVPAFKEPTDATWIAFCMNERTLRTDPSLLQERWGQTKGQRAGNGMNVPSKYWFDTEILVVACECGYELGPHKCLDGKRS